jgi:hypothetical protein
MTGCGEGGAMTDAQHQIRSVRYTGLNGGGFSL